MAMAVVLPSGHPAVYIAGYALVGAGLAPVVPILFNAAARVPGTSRAAAIAAVSSIGHKGFMIGPPLIAGLAQALSLTAAMWVVAIDHIGRFATEPSPIDRKGQSRGRPAPVAIAVVAGGTPARRARSRVPAPGTDVGDGAGRGDGRVNGDHRY
jgi:hypothetical protein